MTRTYQPEDLDLQDARSLAWALAWVRQLAGDFPNEGGAWPMESAQDAIWRGWLNGTRAENGAYRPHEAAAQAILANPNWLTREVTGDYTAERRTPEEVAAGIRQAGAWMDAMGGTSGARGGGGLSPAW